MIKQNKNKHIIYYRIIKEIEMINFKISQLKKNF